MRHLHMVKAATPPHPKKKKRIFQSQITNKSSFSIRKKRCKCKFKISTNFHSKTGKHENIMTYVPEKARIPVVKRPPNWDNKVQSELTKEMKGERRWENGKELTMLGCLVIGAARRAAVWTKWYKDAVCHTFTITIKNCLLSFSTSI